jgi:hypothetical protein
MHATITSEKEELYGISEKDWQSKGYGKLYGYDVKEKFEEYSKIYQEGKVNPQNVLDEIVRTGKAKMLQDAIKFIHDYGDERWQSFKQNERNEFGKSESSRKVAYLTLLNTQLEKGENATIGIPLE